MANPSKQKGTRAETRVVNWLHDSGWVKAERLALSGSADKGDVMIDPDVPGIIEVKWRGQSSTPHGQLRQWLDETTAETKNRGSDWGVLLVNRYRCADPSEWHAYLPGGFLHARATAIGRSWESGFTLAGDVMMSGWQFLNWVSLEYRHALRGPADG